MPDTDLGSFGDSRLACVGGELLAAMQRKRTLCIHRLSTDRNQTRRFGRFLANYRVTVHEMLATQRRSTAQRAAGRHVLAVMDTTKLSFPTHHVSKRTFGKDTNGEHPGLFLHPVLAVDADNGGILGLIDCTVIDRTGGKVENRKKRPADEKESYRWLESARIAAGLTETGTVTMVADRESDGFDFLAHRPDNVHVLIRSAQARTLVSRGLLPEHVAGLSEQGRDTIEVPPKGDRKARQAVVALRFDAIVLKRPQGTRAADAPASVALWVVDAREADPPAGETPVHWRLLTTHPVETLDGARQIVAWYRMRWTIEQVFRSLKSHCLRIEDSQIETAVPFAKLAMVALIAAVHSMQLVLARDGKTAQPIADAVDPADMPALRDLNASLEGRTAKLKNPYDETTLAWFVWVVARLGGWSGYTSKGYRPPGPKTMHHGLLEVDRILTGWHLANRSADVRLL
jgi:hypothetical protein